MKATFYSRYARTRAVFSKWTHQTFGRSPMKWSHPLPLGVCGALLFASSAPGATFRYASSSNRIYVEGGGSATLTDIKAALPGAPLDLVDAANKIWLLRATLFVADGSTLALRGAAVGGDVNELRLLSNNSTATNSVVIVDADWGTLDLNATRVTSWDAALNGPDTEYQTFQRAFIRARSRQVGTTNQQSTLNVINSDIGYLGFNDSQGYSLTWQAVGSVTGLRVFGNVSGSRIHHCQLGASTWSVDDVSWTSNEIDHNTLHGFNAADSGHQAALTSNNVHDNDIRANARYVSSSNRIYVENGGATTLTEIKVALPNAPLALVDAANKIWLLRANVFVTGGSTLSLRGAAAGGDVNELRLLSNNNGASNSVVIVDADSGALDLNATRVTSWDEAVNGADTEYELYRRAFIRARSRQVGTTTQQSTLTVTNSDIGYLGFKDSQSYGLTWQVVGSVSGVRVFGNVSGGRIHDCQLGVSTWSVDDVSWAGAEIDHNTLNEFNSADPGHQAVLANNNVHDNEFPATFRWSSTSQRIYVTGPGSGTLSEMKAALPSAPLVLVDPANKVWHIGADVFVENGARLKLYGPALGGDVAELRLKSDNTTATNAFVELRADWGWLDIRNTKITSWDSAANAPDTETGLYGRAFVRARSTLDADGVTPRESRMDIVASDVGYLGWNDSESYGLVWKVVGTSATNLPTGLTIFDLVEVRGDVLNSRLHDNYFGMYTYGHSGGHWATNEVDHNLGDGIRPDDDSDNLVIEGNNVHHNGLHGIIASARCDHGILRNNVSWANADNGLMLHRSSDDWLVEGNRSVQNGGSGIAIFAASRALIRNNVCLSNNSAGIRLSVGAADNIVTNNQVGSSTNGFRIYKDDDIPNPGDDGRPKRNLFVNNLVYECRADAVRVQNGDANSFVGNTFTAAGATELRFENATNNLVSGNSFPTNVLIRSIGTTNSPTFTTFKGQPQLTLQMDTFGAATFRDDRGAVFDFGTPRLPTPVYPTGSVCSVTRSDLGGTVAVITRNLFVTPNSGSARVIPTAWILTGNQTKSWTTQTAAGTTAVRYQVGDLVPGARYSVSAGSSLGSFAAGPLGNITFVFTNSAPSLPTTNSFTVALEGQNSAPSLPAQADRTIGPGTQLVVTNAASDPDSPPASLTYFLDARNLADNGVIANAAISNNGIITWMPGELFRGTTNRFTTRASDGFSTVSNSFRVIVADVAQTPEMSLRIERMNPSTAVISWPAPASGWFLQQNSTLTAANWADATNAVSLVNGRNQASISLSGGMKFFRLIQR